jgi:hypothetical protein
MRVVRGDEQNLSSALERAPQRGRVFVGTHELCRALGGDIALWPDVEVRARTQLVLLDALIQSMTSTTRQSLNSSKRPALRRPVTCELGRRKALTMPVTEAEAATLQALLAGDFEDHQQKRDQLADSSWPGYPPGSAASSVAGETVTDGNCGWHMPGYSRDQLTVVLAAGLCLASSRACRFS